MAFFKPDASFFRKIVIGAVGANAVRRDLAQHGFELVELERGATDTKIWKDVKRKRVRIPDLVCLKTGIRIESRAKTKTSLQMSHSPDEAERAWDYGMVDDDWIAFPTCESVEYEDWSEGKLQEKSSYFHQRQWETFERTGAINYFTVEEFRRVAHSGGRRKGVVEASEYSIEWDATFSTRTGPVRYVEHDGEKRQHKVCIENSEGRAYTWRVDDTLEVLVDEGDEVHEGQVFASSVIPISPRQTEVAALASEAISDRYLDSKERTLRFTGVKLARLRGDIGHVNAIRDLSEDREEDLYVRLEALSYLCAVADEDVREAFDTYLNSDVEQDALEAVICIGEVGNQEAVAVLAEVLSDVERAYFLRSASAWSLGRIAREDAQEVLIRAFSDQDLAIREEALRGLVSLGETAVPKLIHGLREDNAAVAAGSAEALRRFQRLEDGQVGEILRELEKDDPSTWAVWLIGNLPQEQTAGQIAAMQNIDSEVHYGLSLLWSFSRSWISRSWERYPLPSMMKNT